MFSMEATLHTLHTFVYFDMLIHTLVYCIPLNMWAYLCAYCAYCGILLHTTRQSTQCKLIANKTRTLASSQSILQMGPQIWNTVPTELYMRNSLLVTCARFSSRLKRSTLEGYGDKSLTSS